MKHLYISLLLLLSLSGCGVQPPSNLTVTNTTTTTFANPYFSDPAKDYVYKAKIEAFGHHFGGLFILKKTSETAHRIVFTSEFGSKFFDFTLEGHQLTTNFILPELDKKIVLNMLKKDFMVLLQPSIVIEKAYSSKEGTVFSAKHNKDYLYYYTKDADQKLSAISVCSKRKEKVLFTFAGTQPTVAQQVTIVHKTINLSIDLDFISK